MKACRKTELLIDGDQHSTEQIKNALNLLQNQGCKVKATLFAEPRRVENTKWRQFMKKESIVFQPVKRSKDVLSEANDEAIYRALLSISTRDPLASVALVTSDADFIDVLEQLQNCGLDVVVLIPELRYSIVAKYRDARIKVLKLVAAKRGPRVRAVLDSDGSGSVHFAQPYRSFDNSAVGKSVVAFLKELGFMPEGGFLLPAAAKFWFVNQLGPLTVFPKQIATTSVHDIIVEGSCEGCQGYTAGLAFVQPVSSKPNLTTSGLRKFGSRNACQIFQGGGPFMLQDSPDLTVRVLKRLGYLDDDMNDDLTEALFCFLNSAENKNNLRTNDILPYLPDTGARSFDVSERLRAAFLSHGTLGSWQYMRKDKSSMEPVLSVLRKAKVIGSKSYVQLEVFEAMKMYSKRHGLPTMQTFNGLAARILQSVNKDPVKRTVIEVKRWKFWRSLPQWTWWSRRSFMDIVWHYPRSKHSLSWIDGRKHHKSTGVPWKRNQTLLAQAICHWDWLIHINTSQQPVEPIHSRFWETLVSRLGTRWSSSARNVSLVAQEAMVGPVDALEGGEEWIFAQGFGKGQHVNLQKSWFHKAIWPMNLRTAVTSFLSSTIFFQKTRANNTLLCLRT